MTHQPHTSQPPASAQPAPAAALVQNAAYQPMRNDYRDFDPAGPWSYILDMSPPPAWRALTAPNVRHQAWPFMPRQRFQAIKLVPDWCYRSWHPHAVLAWPGWDNLQDAADNKLHQVTARIWIEQRTLEKSRRQVTEWTGTIRIDLRARTWTWHPCGRDAAKVMPEGVAAQIGSKAGKLLGFFGSAIGHWRSGDQDRPRTALDLYLLDHLDPTAEAVRIGRGIRELT